MTNSGFDPRAFQHVLGRLQLLTTPADLSQRWLLLEAAHVLGQTRLRPHLTVHVLMLSTAWRAGEWAEVAGQLFRLLLVPLGHLTGRLPLGNPGRSAVSAFLPMAVRPELQQVLDASKRAAQASP